MGRRIHQLASQVGNKVVELLPIWMTHDPRFSEPDYPQQRNSRTVSGETNTMLIQQIEQYLGQTAVHNQQPDQ